MDYHPVVPFCVLFQAVFVEACEGTAPRCDSYQQDELRQTLP